MFIFASSSIMCTMDNKVKIGKYLNAVFTNANTSIYSTKFTDRFGLVAVKPRSNLTDTAHQ